MKDVKRSQLKLLNPVKINLKTPLNWIQIMLLNPHAVVMFYGLDTTRPNQIQH